jgi:hypothetical protein
VGRRWKKRGSDLRLSFPQKAKIPYKDLVCSMLIINRY